MSNDPDSCDLCGWISGGVLLGDDEDGGGEEDRDDG